MDQIKQKKTTEILRMIVQIVFFLVFPSAFASAFSAVKDVFAAFAAQEPLTLTPFGKILIFLIAFTAIFGRFFCGYACAFGAAGDWIWKLSQLIRQKTGKKFPAIPGSIRKSESCAQKVSGNEKKSANNAQKLLQCGKYLILGIILILCFMGQSEVVNQNSPWTVFSLLRSGKLPGKEMIPAVILLVIIIAGMAVCERFFCQYLCPLGAVFSVVPVLPAGALKRHEETCIPGCSLCARGCPVSLKLGTEEIREGECIRCNRCIAGCPRGSISGGLPVSTASHVLVIVQAAALLLVLKFVI